MPNPLNMIEGDVLPEANYEAERLQKRVRDLERDLDDARREARRAREDAERALGMLRKQLSPLYRALQAVFGELDAAGVGDDAGPTGVSVNEAVGDSKVRKLWQSWIDKFGPGSIQGRVVLAMLDHGPMTTEQIRVAAKIGTSSAFEAIKRLKKLGLIDKNHNGKYALKEL